MQCYCTFLSLALGTFIILLTVLRVGFIRYLPFTIRFVNVAVAFCFLPLSTRTVISADRVIQKETQHNNCLHWRSCFLLLLLLLFFFFWKLCISSISLTCSLLICVWYILLLILWLRAFGIHRPTSFTLSICKTY